MSTVWFLKTNSGNFKTTHNLNTEEISTESDIVYTMRNSEINLIEKTSKASSQIHELTHSGVVTKPLFF